MTLLSCCRSSSWDWRHSNDIYWLVCTNPHLGPTRNGPTEQGSVLRLWWIWYFCSENSKLSSPALWVNHNRPSLGNRCWQLWTFLVNQTSFLKHPNGVWKLFLPDFSHRNVFPAGFSLPCLLSHRILWSPALSLCCSRDISQFPHL